MTIPTPIVRTLLTMGLLSFLCGCCRQEERQPAKQKFTELSPENSARLEEQRGVVAAVAKQRYGTAILTKTKGDLPILQRLLDDRAFAKTQTYELQCLGVAFGDVLAMELPLRWMMVIDEYGTDPTLRYRNTTIQINALTMLSKRVEQSEDVDVGTMLRMTGEQIAHLEKEFQK